MKSPKQGTASHHTPSPLALATGRDKTLKPRESQPTRAQRASLYLQWTGHGVTGWSGPLSPACPLEALCFLLSSPSSSAQPDDRPGCLQQALLTPISGPRDLGTLGTLCLRCSFPRLFHGWLISVTEVSA